MSAVTVRAPAKVNLQLSVGALRSDGFHDLVNVFQAVSLFDEVTAEPGRGVAVAVTGEGATDVPAGGDNLAVRAALTLAEHAAVPADVSLTIVKRIPVAAGMAGGSADAAAALVACNELWRAGLRRAELTEIAAGIGSDVPFALMGGTAVGIGRGERLTPALGRGRFEWVFAFAPDGLSTPEVYAECDRRRAAAGIAVRPPRLNEDLMAALRSGDPVGLAGVLGNDLQPAAISLYPRLRRVLAAGRECGALAGIVCGSGPTCAFLAGSEEEAIELAVALSGAGVCRAVARAHGPVPGAA